MSQKRKNQRARHEEQEKQRAETVIKWIIGLLVVAALAYGICITMMM